MLARNQGVCAVALFLLWVNAWALWAEPEPGRTSSAVIHVYLFGSKGCADCRLLENRISQVGLKLGCEVTVHRFDVDDLSEYKRLLAMERRYGRTAESLPVIFVGEHMLDAREAEKKLEPLLFELVQSGGAAELDIPSPQDAEQTLSGGPAVGGSIYLAYFRQPGCRACGRVERMLELAQQQTPGLVVKRFSAQTRQGKLLLEVLSERAGLEEELRLVVPAVFVGSDALVREQITDESLQEVVRKHVKGSSGVTWEVSAEELDAARERLIARFGKIRLLPVVTGGLLDSVNPCAFATLVFLISYLAALGRKGRAVIAVGGAFTAGVFLAYFATGLGLSEVLLRLEVFPRVAAAVTWAIILLTFVLAALSLHDFVRALRGQTGSVALKLPRPIRMRINRLITRRLHTKTIVAAAFGLGLIVSLLELACTGQVYFPLIRFMNSVSVDQAHAIGLLVIYNLAFVVPLVVIFTAAGLGLSSDRLTAVLNKHIAPVKLAMAIFLTLLGVLLVHFR